MEYLISENQLKFLINEIEYDPEVEKIQKILVKKYDLGNFGPKNDGVDGKAGPLTRKAYQKEFGKELSLKSKTDVKSSGKSPVKSSGSFDAVLVGGLDYRDGDLDIDSQVKLLNSGLGSDKKIKGFRYSTSTRDIEDFLEKNPKIPVYLFSAGCKKANELAVSPYVNKNKLFIIEPYALGPVTKNNVRAAVSSGVPSSNVFVGKSGGRGAGVVSGASSSNSSSHWGALKQVGLMTK
jgi:hypothetical protein